ncbi:MAG: ASCH domain-containing protein [Myxococcales bacterium]|nr:ASCH domain-containing protein [Myxococcales bacterium]
MKPRFAQRIASGRKTVELRRRFPQMAGAPLLLYSTRPVSAIIGCAVVQAVHYDSPTALWRRYGQSSAVTRVEFRDYFRGCARGAAVVIKDYCSLAPLTLSSIQEHWSGFKPPQSYCYAPLDVLRWLATQGNGQGPVRPTLVRLNGASALPPETPSRRSQS